MGVTMQLEYAGELRCALVHGPSGTQLATDAPTDNMGRGEAFSPTDLVGAALLSCAITTMAIKGAQRGYPFTAAAGQVTKEMTQQGPRRIARLQLHITMPAKLSPEQRAFFEETARTCPVALSLNADVAAEMQFVYPHDGSAAS